MKVLLADKLSDVAVEGLKKVGCEVTSEPDLKGDELIKRVKESQARILVVRSTKVPREAMVENHLSLIVRAGAGFNNIDVPAASDNGILVTNCPGKNSQAVAELAFGLILSIDRKIPDNVAQLRQGKWNKKGFSKSKGIHGRTLGLVGMGKIGQEMIPRAKAFGMNIVAFSRWMTPTVSAALGIGRVDSLNDVARVSDFVSVHVALTDETRGMIGKEFFDHMQDGAGFINTSRAEVVQQDALLGALNEGRIMAGLDVFEDEPAPSDQEYHGVMKDAPNAYCTHHIGASTEQAQEAVAEEVVHIVSEYVQKGHAPNVVNIPAAGDREWLMTVRHANKVGVLSYVLGLLKDDEVNVLEVENIILGTAAIAQIAVDRKPSDKTMEDISIYRDIFDASLTRIDLVS